MKWTPGTQNDDVVDVRGDSNASGGGGSSSGGGGGGGFGLPHIGGAGGVVVVIIYIAIKVIGGSSSTTTSTSSSSSTSTSSSSSSSSTSSSYSHSSLSTHTETAKGNDPDAALVDFIKFVLKDVQDTFDKKFTEIGKSYTHAKLYIFTSVIDTACGRSSSEIGPFYCPGDNHAYIDLSFYRDLRDRFGAPGNFAQAYVLAHELGHHVQNLLGTDAKVARTKTRGEREKNALSVKVELQADCYAGVWGHEAQTRGLLEEGDLSGALTAAAAIGDDRLEKQAGVPVDAETFTHGTSEQRMRWFRRGFETGKLDACDTFTAQDL